MKRLSVLTWLCLLLSSALVQAQTAPPGTISVPPGQAIPAGQWIERANPSEGKAFMAGRGGKHGRMFYRPAGRGLSGGMVFAGGDWHTSQPQYEDGSGVGSEIWHLDALNDNWTLLRPFCVPGENEPGGPDTVGWAYDNKRDRGLMNPGFYFGMQGAKSPCGSIYGLGGYAFSFVDKKFSGPDGATLPLPLSPPPDGWGGDGVASYSVYDPVADELVRIANGGQMQRLNLASQKWRTQSLTNGTPNWNPVANRAQLVIDVAGRALYWLDVWSPVRALIKVSLVNGAVKTLPLPAQYVLPAGSDHEVYLAFDPGHRVILIPNNFDMGTAPLNGLGIYHVDTGAWDWQAVPPAVFGSVWGFDEAVGALIGIGKRVFPSAYFLYKVK